MKENLLPEIPGWELTFDAEDTNYKVYVYTKPGPVEDSYFVVHTWLFAGDNTGEYDIEVDFSLWEDTGPTMSQDRNLNDGLLFEEKTAVNSVEDIPQIITNLENRANKEISREAVRKRVTATDVAGHKPNKMSNVMVARQLAKQLRQYSDTFITFVEMFERHGLENLEDDTADVLAANVYEEVQDLLSEFEPRLQEIENEMRQLERIVLSYEADLEVERN